MTVPDPAGTGTRTPGSNRLTNLQIRVLSSVVLVVVVLGLTWLGGLPFRLLCVLIAGAIFYEWTAMCRPNAVGGLSFLPEALMLVFLGALIAGLPATPLLILVAALVLVAVIAAMLRKAPQWEAGGLAYAALSGFSLAYLRGGDHAGLIAILFLFAVVWATDILAYFVGRAIGGPKLAPSISPGKTWSGAIGGALGGLAAGLAIAAVTGWGGLWAGRRGAAARHRRPDRRSVRIVRQAAQRRQGFQPHHSGAWRRHGPRRRACRRCLHPIRDRRAVRQRRQSGIGIGGRLSITPFASHGFAGIGATLTGPLKPGAS